MAASLCIRCGSRCTGQRSGWDALLLLRLGIGVQADTEGDEGEEGNPVQSRQCPNSKVEPGNAPSLGRQKTLSECHRRRSGHPCHFQQAGEGHLDEFDDGVEVFGAVDDRQRSEVGCATL